MGFLFVILAVSVGILIFRGYRLVHFYIESNNNPDEEERKIAHKNYIVHLIFFLLILAVVIFIVRNLLITYWNG